MTTEQDELQAKEFLKRVEIITMKKDLRKLREVDALKERDKIVTDIVAQEEKAKQDEKRLQESKEEFERGKILNENYVEELEAEKQLKAHATEEEKQKIFILDSQRIELDKKAKEDRAKKEPELVMKKNDLTLEKQKIQEKLNSIKDEEGKIEGEQNVLAEKEKTTNIAAEREGLEKSRWDLEAKREEIEKRRWAVEKEISDKDKEIEAVDLEYKKMIEEENQLREKILGIDKQLRQIYSQIVLRIQEAKKKEEEEKRTAQSEVAKAQTKEMEKIQRQQWAKTPSMASPEKDFLESVPSLAKQKLQKQAQDEEAHRKKFLHDVETKAKEEESK